MYLVAAVPEAAKLKSYITLERNGFVFLWHHAEDIDPVWEPPEIDEIASGQWKYCGRSEHFVNAHIEVCIWALPRERWQPWLP